MQHRRSEKCVAEGSKYAHWIGLYPRFHLSWVLGPFVHGRLQNMKTSEDTLDHDITLVDSHRCMANVNKTLYPVTKN